MTLLCVVALSLAAQTSAAPAPSTSTAIATADEARARDLYRAGSEAYEAAHYDVAVDAFEAALSIMRPAPLLFSAAQAHRFRYFVTNDIAHLEAAVALFREYLSLDAAGTRRDHASEHLAVLAPMLERQMLEHAARSTAPTPARVIITSPTPGARVTVDNGDAVDAPAAVPLNAGVHTIRVSAAGYDDAVEQVTAVDGASFAVRLPLTPTPGTLVIDADANAQVLLDGQPLVQRTVQVAPGTHVVTARQHGHNTRSTAVDVGAASTTSVSLPQTLTTQTTVSRGALIVGGVVVASALAPVVVALVAENEAATLDAAHAVRALNIDEANRYGALRAQRDGANAVAVSLVGAGAVLLLSGALGALLDVPDERGAP